MAAKVLKKRVIRFNASCPGVRVLGVRDNPRAPVGLPRVGGRARRHGGSEPKLDTGRASRPVREPNRAVLNQGDGRSQ